LIVQVEITDYARSAKAERDVVHGRIRRKYDLKGCRDILRDTVQQDHLAALEDIAAMKGDAEQGEVER
jgi:hypothetical protein